MTTTTHETVAQLVTQARLNHGWSKEEAARRAGVSSITWKRVEDGLRVQDAKLRAIEVALGCPPGTLCALPLAGAEAFATRFFGAPAPATGERPGGPGYLYRLREEWLARLEEAHAREAVAQVEIDNAESALAAIERDIAASQLVDAAVEAGRSPESVEEDVTEVFRAADPRAAAVRIQSQRGQSQSQSS